jgi:hypothetical protein
MRRSSRGAQYIVKCLFSSLSRAAVGVVDVVVAAAAEALERR